jgi:phosphonate transport system permease protein
MSQFSDGSAAAAAASGSSASDIDARYGHLIRPGWRSRLIPMGAVTAIALYLVYAVFFFNVPSIMSNARGDLIGLYMLDMYAHKVHVTKEVGEPDEVTVRIEGDRFSEYETPPDWVQVDGQTQQVDLGDDGRVIFQPGRVLIQPTDRPEIAISASAERVQVVGGEVPSWMRVSERKIDARISQWSRVQVTRNDVEVHRYFFGWENFFFTFDSELKGKSVGELIDLAFFSDEQLDFDMPNWQFILHEFWENPEWQHGIVFWALVQTLIMAVVGTMVAGIVALPLAFAAAYNINPLASTRFALKRLFDGLRAVDHLIWSLIFIRAFGLGPLSGIFAFIFTETGTFGKLFSEAIENIDRREPEGVQATGASRIQKYRFGVLPQILPVFVSQILYFFEANTRSATVVGALGAGGIGLKLIETIKTRQDWENTLYMIILIILIVVLMDTTSGWLRKRLIGTA